MISAASTRNPWDSTHSRISHSDESWGRFPTNSFDITSSVSFSRNAEHKKPEQTVVFGEFRTPPFLFSGCGGLCTRVGIAKKLPPQARRGGSAANKKLRSHLSPRRRVVKRTILLTSTTPAAATASASPPRLRRGVWWLLLRDSHRLLALRCIGLARLRKCCIVVVNEPLQYGMSGEAFEMVLLHFLIRAVSTPAVQSHS